MTTYILGDKCSLLNKKKNVICGQRLHRVWDSKTETYDWFCPQHGFVNKKGS